MATATSSAMAASSSRSFSRSASEEPAAATRASTSHYRCRRPLQPRAEALAPDEHPPPCWHSSATNSVSAVDNGRPLMDTAAANSASAVHAVVLRLEVVVPAALPRCHHTAAAVAGQVDLVALATLAAQWYCCCACLLPAAATDRSTCRLQLLFGQPAGTAVGKQAPGDSRLEK